VKRQDRDGLRVGYRGVRGEGGDGVLVLSRGLGRCEELVLELGGLRVRLVPSVLSGLELPPQVRFQGCGVPAHLVEFSPEAFDLVGRAVLATRPGYTKEVHHVLPIS
jgi:hypothetical protein